MSAYGYEYEVVRAPLEKNRSWPFVKFNLCSFVFIRG